MKLPIEKQAASPFNQMVELGVPVRIAKAVSEMLAVPGTKTASRVVVAKAVQEASSMLCKDMQQKLAIPAAPTAKKLVQNAIFMSEEEEEAAAEKETLHLSTDTVKLAYAVAQNMGVPQDHAMMLAMYAHTRLMGL